MSQEVKHIIRFSYNGTKQKHDRGRDSQQRARPEGSLSIFRGNSYLELTSRGKKE